MGLALVIIIPVMGVMYIDMHNATIHAVKEIQKMKELRLQLLRESRGGQ